MTSWMTSYGPQAVSEQALGEQATKHVPAGSVIIGDRNFALTRAPLPVGLFSVGLFSAGGASGTRSSSEVSAVSWISCVMAPNRVRRPPPAMRFCLQRCLLLLL